MPSIAASPSASRRACGGRRRAARSCRPVHPAARRARPPRGRRPGASRPHELAGPTRPLRRTSALPTTTEPTGQARPLERQKVALSALGQQLAGRCAQRDDRVEEASAVDVERHPVLAGDGGDGGACTSARSGWPMLWAWVFSSMTSDVRAAWMSVASRTACADGLRGPWRPSASGCHGPDRGAADDGMAAGLVDETCDSASATISPPRGTWAMCDTRLPIVPLATKRPAALPVSSAARSWRALTVGSSPKTSSPDLGLGHGPAHLRRGRVTVSERRSMRSGMSPSIATRRSEACSVAACYSAVLAGPVV